MTIRCKLTTGAYLLWGLTACAADGVVKEPTSALLVPPPMSSAHYHEDKTLTKLMFGSCFVPQFEESGIWTTINQAEPDAFVLLGDNVYQSEENGHPDLLELRDAYNQLSNDPAFTEFRNETPLWITWDDHDYGMNDAGAEFAARYESEILFEDVWDIGSDDPRRSRDGIYYQRIVGTDGTKTQIIVLDTRFFKTDQTVLGEEQWAWLENALKRPANLRIIASSIPVMSDYADGENWSRWPAERRRLFDMLESLTNVAIISGDSHYAAYYEHKKADGSTIVEVTSSSLNFPISESGRTRPGPTDPGRSGPVFYPENFGGVEIDWLDATFSLNIYDKQGKMVRSEPQTLK